MTLLKVPFYGEQWKRQLLHLAQRTGFIDKVRIVFQSEKNIFYAFPEVQGVAKTSPQLLDM